ncbi:hypothetical protein C9446_11160 [Providencia heimbachae]|uniref:host cell division inhibitor Icd-like protein n=1 Tax=Providencia heimbachae TaxID=333962 RepID=UPI0010BE74DE|nr:host cell division inhibitor Icd-like protein [Providencia heimbachae]QCJ70363.1 hypothetical protein C9446_11160 [Providencia heimbachae]
MPTIHYLSNNDLSEVDMHTGLFRFCFLAVKRIDPAAKWERIEVQAPSLKAAKLQLVRDYVLSLASQIPTGAK